MPVSTRAKSSRAKSSRDKVRKHRALRRKQGMRLVQMWVPDTRTKAFTREAARQSRLIAQSPHEAKDQAFVDSISVWTDDDFWNSGDEWDEK